jgi:hypothetical protein
MYIEREGRFSWLLNLTEEVAKMAKAYCYCPECKKMLTQVLSSFECLSTWDTIEDYYVPGADCRLVNRCPDCGTLTKEKERKIDSGIKNKTGKEGLGPAHSKKKPKETRRAV